MTKKMAIIGIMMAMNNGITVAIRMMVEKKVTIVLSQTRIFVGNVESQTSISFANLFIILPNGVVSKNDIGLRITR